MIRFGCLFALAGLATAEEPVVEVRHPGPHPLGMWVPLDVLPAGRVVRDRLVVRPLGSSREILVQRAEGGVAPARLPLWLDDPQGTYTVHVDGRWVQTLALAVSPTWRPRTLWLEARTPVPHALWEVDAWTALYAPGREDEPRVRRVASWLAAPRRAPESPRALRPPVPRQLLRPDAQGGWILLGLPLVAAAAWLCVPRRRLGGALVVPLVALGLAWQEYAPADWWPSAKRAVLWHLVAQGGPPALWVEEVRFGEGAVELGAHDVVRPLRGGRIDGVVVHGARTMVHFRGGIVRRRWLDGAADLAVDWLASLDGGAAARAFAEGVRLEREGLRVRAVARTAAFAGRDTSWGAWDRWPGRRAGSRLVDVGSALLREGVARARTPRLAWSLPRFLRSPSWAAPWRTVLGDLPCWLLRAARLQRADAGGEREVERVVVARWSRAPADPFSATDPAPAALVLWGLGEKWPDRR